MNTTHTEQLPKTVPLLPDSKPVTLVAKVQKIFLGVLGPQTEKAPEKSLAELGDDVRGGVKIIPPDPEEIPMPDTKFDPPKIGRDGMPLIPSKKPKK